MDITINKGNVDYISECVAALQDSELGRRYFSQSGSAHRALEEGFANEEIYVALDNNDLCVGFIWIIWKGAFHSFPYLHIVAVKEEFRSQGIGKKLMQFFEGLCFATSSKVFLVVADFNPEARKLYKSIGYTEIGPIHDLYRVGITEYLMMKSKKE